MIVAIDGPSGSGKSSMAKRVAKELGLHYLDTGAMYRAVAFLALERRIDLNDADALESIALNDKIEFVHDEGEAIAKAVKIAGIDCTKQIRTPEIDKAVSPVATCAKVRSALVNQQRQIGALHNTVMEGRDIGTVVFPNAEVKIFMTASAEERAKRRYLQNQNRGMTTLSYEEILEDINRRDRVDSTRDTSPLKAADDAIMLDTTNMTKDEVCEFIKNAYLAVAKSN
ncbi:MAG: (d)CMP kinase [Coriobacteriales bacterium]|nr:(d)CMP kinase [Coriobacteriales bacterium]